jgi:hypothetical protein
MPRPIFLVSNVLVMTGIESSAANPVLVQENVGSRDIVTELQVLPLASCPVAPVNSSAESHNRQVRSDQGAHPSLQSWTCSAEA